MALIKPFGDQVPRISPSVWLAENASVIGDVEIGEESNIWYGCVVRGDVGKVRFGKRVNLQDLCTVHMTTNVSDAIIEDDASIGHNVVIHGAIIGAGALVGMGCIVMDNAQIGEEALIGAGSLVTAGTVIPPRSLAIGRPAKVVRQLSDDEARTGRKTSAHYVELARKHRVDVG